MSRTIRKRSASFESYYKLGTFRSPLGKSILVDNHCNEQNIHYQRDKNIVNRKRRSKDKMELYKELNTIEYENQCSKWNCKDSNSWGYF